MPKTAKKAPKKVEQKIVVKEIIREVIKEVEKPQLEGYELYAQLRDIGYFQGGSGFYIEDPNGIDKVYVPTVPELISSLAADPQIWEIMRDGVIRAYIEACGERDL